MTSTDTISASDRPTDDTETPETPDPRIYVADLSDYNAGRNRGVWITLDGIVDAEDIGEQIQKMLAAAPDSSDGPHEEYRVHDHEGFGFSVEEHPDLDQLVLAAEAIEQHGDLFGAVADNFHGDIEVALKTLEEDYRGSADSLEDWIRDDLEESCYFEGWPDAAIEYFDWASYERDLDANGSVWTVETGGLTHVFNNS